MSALSDDEEWLSTDDPDFWPFLGAVVLLVLTGGVMSGLQQGLMQLDRPAVRALKEEYAESSTVSWLVTFVEKLIARRHFTLVTLLVSNSIAMESLPIFFDVLVPKYFAILFSVTLLLIFGEILPQALCLKYPAEFACLFAPLIWSISIILYPVAHPISLFLDWLLGEEHGRTYTRIGLGELAREQAGQLSSDELDVITGALELYEKVASDIVLPRAKVFMLSHDEQLSDKVLRNILEHGHSRVPVWKDTEENIVGLLLVKHLIRLNPDNDTILVRDLHIVPCFNVQENCSLFALLRAFQTGASHMTVVTKCSGQNQPFWRDGNGGGQLKSSSPASRRTRAVSKDLGPLPMTSVSQKPLKCLGIITLEDVIEKLLKRSIEDETDVWKPVNQTLDNRLSQVRVLREEMLHSLERGGQQGADVPNENDSLTGGELDRRSSYGSLNSFEQANGSRASSSAAQHEDGSALLRMMGDIAHNKS